MHQGPPLIPILRAVSTVISSLTQATFTPCIHPNFCLPHTRTSLNSTINTLLSIRYWFILFMFPHHLNTLWSTLYLPIPRHFHLFYTQLHSQFYPFVTHPPNFTSTLLSRISLFISQYFSYSMPLLLTTQSAQLLLHIELFALIPNPVSAPHASHPSFILSIINIIIIIIIIKKVSNARLGESDLHPISP